MHNLSPKGRSIGRSVSAAICAAALTVALFAASPVAASPLPFWKKCETGSGAGQCKGPVGIATDPNTGHVYVADVQNERINELDPWGEFVKAWGWGVRDGAPELQTCGPGAVPPSATCQQGLGGSGAGEFSEPRGVTVDSAGNVYVVDSPNHRVEKFSDKGEFLLMFGAGVLDHGAAAGSGDVSAGSSSVTSVTTASRAFVVGQTITGAGIPAETKIKAIAAGAITLSQPATASGVAVALTVPATPGVTSNNELQRFAPEATGGTFALSFRIPAPDGSEATTPAIPFNASAAEVDSALEALAPIGSGNVAVSGPDGGPYTVEFEGARFSDTNVSAIVLQYHNLIGSPYPGGSGSLPAQTLVDGASAAEICTLASLAEGYACGAGGTGAANGQFEEWIPGSIFQQSGGGNVIAAGPDGLIYVGDKDRIQRFDTNGVYEGQVLLPEAGVVNSLAIDPNTGDLYFAYAGKQLHFPINIAVQPNVYRLDSTTGAVLDELEVGLPTALATDAAGDIYVFDAESSNGNPGESVNHPSRILQFDSTGSQTSLFAVGELAGSYVGIATGSACLTKGADLYASNTVVGSANAFVQAYGQPPDKTALCPPPQAPPAIRDQFVLSADPNDALLRAKIDPRFWADSRYYVQYGTAACIEAGWEAPCVKEQPAAPGVLLGAGPVDADVTVSVFLTGLQAGAAYRFRFAASSGGGGPVFGVGGSEAQVGKDAGFTTPPLPTPPPPDSCPNAQLRIGAAGKLPDCRAYEMVSPVDKGGNDIVTNTGFGGDYAFLRTAYMQSSLDGDKITYSSATAFGDAKSSRYSNQYIASRGGSGWSTHGISPPQGTTIYDPGIFGTDITEQFSAFTPDLSSAWAIDDNKTPLTADAIEGYENAYRIDTAGDSYEALTVNEPIGSARPGYPRRIGGHSKDLSHVILEATAKLTPAAAPSTEFLTQLYDFTGGELDLVSVLPNGTASAAAANRTLAVSEDGSRIFWTVSGLERDPGAIYVRLGDEATVKLSTGIASFWGATPDGSTILFSEAGNLYEEEVETQAKTLIAHNAIGVAGASEDLSRIYFGSKDALAPGAVGGQRNLYLDREGVFTFIAKLSAADTEESAGEHVVSGPSVLSRKGPARVTPDGRQLAFESVESLPSVNFPSGYENTDIHNGEPDLEVYVYDAETERLTCASCRPSGRRPEGRPLLIPYTSAEESSPLEIGGGPERRWSAAWLPTREHMEPSARSFSADGRHLFFNSFDALVPADTNGAQDVYEWEAQDIGGCQKAGGCIGLISSGESPHSSEFIDASTDGRDAFFSTSSSLLPQDPGLIDIYDARAGGGFPTPASPPECLGDTCQNVPAAPNDPSPASAGFKGPGDPAPAKPRQGCRAHKRGTAKHKAKRKRAKGCKRATRRAGR
jgi:hypothetical protein